MDKNLLLSSYDYYLPSELIAFYPASPKEKARLLVYERKTQKITHSTFEYLQDFLPPCAIVLNDTKVIKARIYGHKKSGGVIELFVHSALADSNFLVQIKGRVKKGEFLFFEQTLQAEVIELLENGMRRVRFWQNGVVLQANQLYALLEHIGHLPLPPYIKRKDEQSDLKDYQSVFAKNLGAIAAPTASLHFSQELLEKLSKKHEIHFLTLHIGAGTFKKVECNNIISHKMHSEFFILNQKTADLIDSATPILGIGTTVTRTIEYYARTSLKEGFCDLFLHPHNKILRQNYLLTNFHLPKSTLIMLVCAFIGRKQCLKLYELAIQEKYRFYSYGDAMLVL
ncbi:tRNA preQ1(34) S-adenosylmethionine ribosyltransferase-isomerase QueA [Campylobacter sp. MIT 21-1685]|uniref:tRNA preQ1(34) S-adenosylmethionine ribosyltransferase-isomerase QueA n=1 Tax=unclassified Campylobacter TaxID=2593542 RepID=UPI00224A9BFF|nr:MULTISPECIES: tRNA preQ1(34) S-adenosylmethionine ribosyltransferase-isomerase QueA [unclassified Campylobacter]MCX2682365.1 tRNA preQ1(34) S-adenosylmethionine ribosyltransferase-isomerase QueA [Campylobacter sp. MIT 21-1684]MCX2750645.1 tRNA preQ1(34) S-adenosylmethionine ribosyltransferase-isomerase QueA [Campylobacter sp. MIT 21-1682]MCX2806807.1 tRNA preQ1(34) S-adenosylmethionine ribosyltransferase-isomerase QueA [Campylobacter sp. MIT 21-1685]